MMDKKDIISCKTISIIIIMEENTIITNIIKKVMLIKVFMEVNTIIIIMVIKVFMEENTIIIINKDHIEL